VRMQARRALEMDLRKPLSKVNSNSLPPIQTWDATRFCGFEALLRWNHHSAEWCRPPRSSH